MEGTRKIVNILILIIKQIMLNCSCINFISFLFMSQLLWNYPGTKTSSVCLFCVIIVFKVQFK